MWFLRGQTSDKFVQYNNSQLTLFILDNMKLTTFCIKDNNGKLLVEVIIVTFFNAVAIVDVLTASNTDVNFYQNSNCTFCMTIKS